VVCRDHRHGVFLAGVQRALHVKHDRWIVDFTERSWVIGVALDEGVATEVGATFQFGGEVDPLFPGGYRLGGVITDAPDLQQQRFRRLKNGDGATEVGEQLADADRPDVFDEVERHEGLPFFHGAIG
jgi:hypothetical protein